MRMIYSQEHPALKEFADKLIEFCNPMVEKFNNDIKNIDPDEPVFIEKICVLWADTDEYDLEDGKPEVYFDVCPFIEPERLEEMKKDYDAALKERIEGEV